MSIQAITAVRLHSEFVKDRDFGAFRVLMAIADRAGDDGVCGVVGNPQRCLSYSGIAEAARVHRNTVYNLMPTLLESGELEVVQQGGDGRGSWTVYRVTIIDKLSQGDVTIIQETSQAALAASETSQQTPESSQDKAVMIRLVTIVEELSQQVKRLSQQLAESSQQKPETSQEIVTIVTSNACDSSVEFLESSEEFREERGTPPLPPQKLLLAEMVNALAEVTVMDGHANWGILSKTAAGLLGAYTAGQVLTHYSPGQSANGHWNWYLHDWRGQKNQPPRPKEVLETIKLAINDLIPNQTPTSTSSAQTNGQVDVEKIFKELGLPHE